MATIEDIPSHIVCSQCSTRTQIDKSSALEMFGKVAVTFECEHCKSLLTINSIDNFTTIDIEDDEYPIAEDEGKTSRCPACNGGGN